MLVINGDGFFQLLRAAVRCDAHGVLALCPREPKSSREMSIGGKGYGLILAQQVGPVAPRFFDCGLIAPFGDLGMVAANENLRNGPAAVLGRPGVVREVQDCRGGSRLAMVGARGRDESAKRFVLRRGFVAQRTGDEASYGVDDEHGGQFSSAENVIADGDLLGSKVRRYAFIHTLVAATDEHEPVELGEAASSFLSK